MKKLAALIAIVTGLYAILRLSPIGIYLSEEKISALIEILRSHWWGPVAYTLLYAAACVAAFPGLILTLAGGAIFGTWKGTLYTTIAANLGASTAFWLARRLGRGFVESLLRRQGRSAPGRLEILDQKAQENGFQVILILRLIPLVPFNWLNFGSGFSKIRWRDYALGTLIGMLPATFVYTYFADSLLAGASGAWREAYLHLTAAGMLLILLSFVPKIYKKMKGPLK